MQNFLTGLTDGNIQQQKQILSHLSNSFLRSKTYAEVSTQVIIIIKITQRLQLLFL